MHPAILQKAYMKTKQRKNRSSTSHRNNSIRSKSAKPKGRHQSPRTPRDKKRRSTTVVIPIRKDRHVGTEHKPYKVSHSKLKRYEAMLSGIESRENEMGRDNAILDVKKRLSALRTLNRSKKHIRDAMTHDMKRLDELRGRGTTNDIGGPKKQKKQR